MNHLVRNITRFSLGARNVSSGTTGKTYPTTMPLPAEAYPLVLIISGALVGGSFFAGHKLKEVLAVRNNEPTANNTQSLFTTLTEVHQVISDK